MSKHAKTEDEVLLVILEGIPLVLSKNNINTHTHIHIYIWSQKLGKLSYLDKYRVQLIHTISH